MARAIDLSVDRASAEKVAQDIITDVLKAGVRATAKTTRDLEKEFEAITRATVKGKAWRAWKSKTFPRAGVAAYEPVGEVYVNGGSRSQGMIEYFALPGTNRAKRGKFLAVPLGPARNTAKGRNIGPRAWEAMNGVKLWPLIRPGKATLLMADGAMSSTGAFMPQSKTKLKARQRGGQKLKAAAVPVFALIATQPHANTLSLNGAIQRAQAQLVEEFYKRVGNI